MEKVKIRLDGGFMPTKGSEYAAAYDLYCPEDTELRNGRQVLDLRFTMELPHSYEAVIQTRSGFASKGMEVVLRPREWVSRILGEVSGKRIDAEVIIGLVDEDYRGHVGVIVNNRSFGLWKLFYKAVVPARTRIAQMRVREVPEVLMLGVEDLDMSNDRGGGFGHTGSK